MTPTAAASTATEATATTARFRAPLRRAAALDLGASRSSARERGYDENVSRYTSIRFG